MAKIVFLVALACFVAAAHAIGGLHDIAGNYHDATTGQISSSLTGRVYNTRPTGLGPIGAPLHYGAYAPYGAYGAYGYHGLAAPVVAAPAYYLRR